MLKIFIYIALFSNTKRSKLIRKFYVTEQDESILWNDFFIWQADKILPILWNVKHGADRGFSFPYPWL